MFVQRFASTAAALCGLLMALLTVALYVPQFFLAANAQQQVTAINFIFDTLLFAGTVLVVSKAISDAQSRAISGHASGAGSPAVRLPDTAATPNEKRPAGGRLGVS